MTRIPDPLDKAARDSRIICLQSDLLDHSGHVRPSLPRSRARRLVREINLLRQQNGWAALDMRDRYRPESEPAPYTPQGDPGAEDPWADPAETDKETDR